MKKFILLWFILFTAFLVQPVNAQLQLGVQAGINLADVKFDPKQTGLETSTRTGLTLGGVMVYDFSPVFALQIAPAYIQKGAKVDMSLTESGQTLKIEGTLSGDYLDLPILLKASFADGQIKPYLLAGASLSFLLQDSAKLKIDKATINGQDVIGMIPSSERELAQPTKSTDFILNFGAGITISLNTVNIFVEGQYNLGLTNINDETASPGTTAMTIKTRGIQIKAGLLFPL